VTQDIGALANGFGDAAAQDQFCGDELCTVAILYDQSGRENHLTVAPTNCYGGDYYEADAKRRQLTVGGQPVYALRTDGGEGYRNNDAVGTAEGEAAQGVYSVMDGTDVGEECCWDFGTASRDNCLTPSGSMHALFFGIGYWGSGQGAGPWFMADFSSGVWSGGTAESSFVNPNNPSLSVPYAFGILKSEATNYALRMGDATSGDLITAWDGGIPFENLSLLGGIILGTTGDGTSVSPGTFYEGAITAGRPSDEIDAAVFRSVRALGYGR
jgi:hypothetical protein